MFATGGHELGLRQETLDLLAAPPVAPSRGFYDECMKGDGVHFSLGFMKPSEGWPFGSSPACYGSPGAGGSLGFADPTAGVGYAYITSRMGAILTGDPRDVALRAALYCRSICQPQAAAPRRLTVVMASFLPVFSFGPIRESSRHLEAVFFLPGRRICSTNANKQAGVTVARFWR